MADEVKHYQVGTKYRIKIERAASTKGVDGFTVEAFGDDMALVQTEAQALYTAVQGMTKLDVTVKA